MKKLITIAAVLVASVGIVYAGASGLSNPVNKFLQPGPNDNNLQSKAADFNNDVVTWADAVSGGTTALTGTAAQVNGSLDVNVNAEIGTNLTVGGVLTVSGASSQQVVVVTSVTARDGLTAGTNITATAGNIQATAGTLLTGVGLDAVGAVDLDYGSADVTDHTFVTDGTGDAEIVLPNDSIGDAEIAFDEVTGADLTLTDATAITASGDITANGDIIGDGATIVTNIATIFIGAVEGLSTVYTNTAIGGVPTNVLTFTKGLLTAKTEL